MPASTSRINRRSGQLLVRGDARALPLPDSSVDLIVTSPPYFGLRDYRDDGGLTLRRS
jgi:DNA modification methylase